MPGALPEGEPVPADGSLPEGARGGLGQRPFGIYVHVPFCVTRCGYCDFNTYTAAELGGRAGGSAVSPESDDAAQLGELRAQGVTRMSFGMQSAVPGVLAVLDRVHSPGRPAQCVAWARAAGFEHVSLDLIYGTPGESDDDWRRSLTAAIDAGPDHVSAYALIVEDGTRLAAKVRRGQIEPPDDDAMADRYQIADELLGAAGFTWYELSNWATSDKAQCRHNLLYWAGGNWWGFGPGAHSHVGGVRWWNVKHPTAYAARLAVGHSPAAARERLTAAEREMEEIMLRARLAEGLPLSLLTSTALGETERMVADALIDPSAHAA